MRFALISCSLVFHLQSYSQERDLHQFGEEVVDLHCFAVSGTMLKTESCEIFCQKIGPEAMLNCACSASRNLVLFHITPHGFRTPVLRG
jgi:hypothetical protein